MITDISAFKSFVAEVVAPLCGDETGVVYQCPPSFRIHMPGKSPTIGMHCDSDYEKHHRPASTSNLPFKLLWDSGFVLRDWVACAGNSAEITELV